MKSKILFFLINFFITVGLSSFAVADVSKTTIPSGAYSNAQQTKVYVCHRKGSGTSYVKINISVNGLNGHDGHVASGSKLADEFYVNGKCGGSSVAPLVCTDTQYVKTNGSCASCSSGQIVDDTGEACYTPVAPTVSVTTPTTNTKPTISGTAGSSTVLTVQVGSLSAVTITPDSAGNWTYTPSVDLAAGSYTITVTGDVGASVSKNTATTTLQISPSCVAPKTLDSATNTCVTPASPTTPTSGTSATILDVKGKLLSFNNPTLKTGTNLAKGSSYLYSNVITIDGIQVDAKVTIDDVVNTSLITLDDPAPKPSAKDKTKVDSSYNYTTSYGETVPQLAIFAPQLKSSTTKTQNAYVDFTITFQDTTGKPITLKNVYNNTLDMESVEYNEFGGFSGYTLPNPTDTKFEAGLNGKTRFYNSNCAGDMGLYIKDMSRAQTKFDNISILKLTIGQYADTKVPSSATCKNTNPRYYGAIFVKDGFLESNLVSVDTVISDVAKPALTGSAGSNASITIQIKDSSGVVKNSGTATVNSADKTWTYTATAPLVSGIYDVVATGSSGSDNTTNELTVNVTTTAPTVNNATADDSSSTTISGTFGSSTTAQVTLTSTSTNVSTNLGNVKPDGSGGWTISSGTVTLGSYTITVTDGNDSTAAATLTVNCPTNKIKNAAGTSCITPVAPSVLGASITEDDASVTLSGSLGSATKINTMTINGISITPAYSYSNGWTATVDLRNLSLKAGSYPVIVTGDNGLSSSSANLVVSPKCATYEIHLNNQSGIPSTAYSNDKKSIQICHGGLNGSVVSIDVNKFATSEHYKNTDKTHDLDLFAVNGSCIATTLKSCTVATTVYCKSGEYLINGICTTPTTPTVTSGTASDTNSPSISGSAGSSTAIEIEIKDANGTTIDSGTASVSGGTWQYNSTKVLPIGTYDIVVKGSSSNFNNLYDNTVNELQVISANLPTVDTQTVSNKKPTIAGSFGSATSLIITIKDSKGVQVEQSTSAITPKNANDKTWSYVVQTNLSAGVYDVIAEDASKNLKDATTNELIVQDDIAICEILGNGSNPVTKSWKTHNSAKSFYLGTCAEDLSNPASYTPIASYTSGDYLGGTRFKETTTNLLINANTYTQGTGTDFAVATVKESKMTGNLGSVITEVTHDSAMLEALVKLAQSKGLTIVLTPTTKDGNSGLTFDLDNAQAIGTFDTTRTISNASISGTVGLIIEGITASELNTLVNATKGNLNTSVTMGGSLSGIVTAVDGQARTGKLPSQNYSQVLHESGNARFLDPNQSSTVRVEINNVNISSSNAKISSQFGDNNTPVFLLTPELNALTVDPNDVNVSVSTTDSTYVFADVYDSKISARGSVNMNSSKGSSGLLNWKENVNK